MTYSCSKFPKLYELVYGSQVLLENASPNFAYDMIGLEMDMYQYPCSLDKHGVIKLIQLYMIGIDVLESISDPRSEYFSRKINHLMRNKQMLYGLHQAVTGHSANKECLRSLTKLYLTNRRKELYNLLDRYKDELYAIKYIAAREYKQVRLFDTIRNGLLQQYQALEERIKHRRLLKSLSRNYQFYSAKKSFVELCAYHSPKKHYIHEVNSLISKYDEKYSTNEYHYYTPNGQYKYNHMRIDTTICEMDVKPIRPARSRTLSKSDVSF